MKLGKKTQGYLLILVAFICFGIGSIARTPLVFERKLLVATEAVQGDVFKDAVILVLHHSIGGAFGVILNKQKDGKALGGPLDPGKIIVLHSDEVSLPESKCLADTGICYVEGGYAPGALAALPEKPSWQMTLHGYAGWGFRQIGKEIKAGHWKPVDYNGGIVTRTETGKMWAEANRLPAAKVD